MAVAAEASRRVAGGGDVPHMKLLCSHGGCLVPRGPDGAIRYAGGETRVLSVPRDASFRDLTRRLVEMAGGGAEVLAVQYRLADEALEDVTVSVTCDEELAHMRDEYDRLRATRPAARFRVFVTTAAPAASAGGGVVLQRGRSPASGLPPLAPKMRRVHSEQAQLHRRPTAYPDHEPVRRVQSAPEFAGRIHAQPSFHHQQCCCSCQRPAYPAAVPARPMHAAPPYMSKKVSAAPSTPATGGVVFPTDAAREKARSRDSQAAMERRRAIWEFG